VSQLGLSTGLHTHSGPASLSHTVDTGSDFGSVAELTEPVRKTALSEAPTGTFLCHETLAA
jgi:hypothetical protein